MIGLAIGSLIVIGFIPVMVSSQIIIQLWSTVVFLVAGVQMIRVRWHLFCVIASFFAILAVVNFRLGFVESIVGVWSLVTLQQPESKQAFA